MAISRARNNVPSMPWSALQFTLAAALSILLCLANVAADHPSDTTSTGKSSSILAAGYRMPDEAGKHHSTWVAYVAKKGIWGNKLPRGVKSDLAKIATAISRYEKVQVVVSRGKDLRKARKVFNSNQNITLVKKNLDDLWIRDYGAVFVIDDKGDMKSIGFNFNGWGNKQRHSKDARVADMMAWQTFTSLHRSKLVMEGGGIEVDGEGTAIMTQSCILNSNRNPGITKAEAEQELGDLLGIEKIIWLPGIKGKDITDAHVDFYAKFVRPGVIVAARDDDPESWNYELTREHLTILSKATDARGRNLDVNIIPDPNYSKIRPTGKWVAAGYINHYIGNGFVLMPEFGDKEADAFAEAELRRLHPDRNVEVISIDSLAAGGGGIHCATMQEPQSKF